MMLPRNISDWPLEWREMWEERAAIMEFQGNMPRESAEHSAEADIRKLSAQTGTMKALSLTEPWASAVKLLLKRWETRSWATGFRGQVCIHAAKGFPGDAKDYARHFAMKYSDQLWPANLKLGYIICVAELTACERTEVIKPQLSEQEIEFGDYSAGRFALKLENVQPLITPIPARGALGFWDVLPAEATEIRRQLSEIRKQVPVAEGATA